MEPNQAVLDLGRQLHLLIRRCGVSVSAVSVSLGFNSQQLTRVLNGRRPMSVKLVFDILEQLGVFPFEFFDLIYPLGGVPEALLRRQLNKEPLVGEPSELTLLLRQLELERGGPLRGGEAAERLRRILRREIEAARVTQRSISRTMGRGADALGHALRGDSELTFLHVFAVIAAIGRSPGRIVAELFTDMPASPTGQMAAGHALDVLEQIHGRLATQWSVAPAAGSHGRVEASSPTKPTKKAGRSKAGKAAPKRGKAATRRRT